jgi:hypothetical protein
MTLQDLEVKDSIYRALRKRPEFNPAYRVGRLLDQLPGLLSLPPGPERQELLEILKEQAEFHGAVFPADWLNKISNFVA